MGNNGSHNPIGAFSMSAISLAVAGVIAAINNGYRAIGPKPVAYPVTTQFREIMQDSGTVQKSVTITNHGDQNAVVDSIVSDNSEFVIGHATLPLTLAPNATTVFTVDYTPTASTAQQEVGDVTISYGDGTNYTCYLWAYKITAAPAAEIVLSGVGPHILDIEGQHYRIDADMSTTVEAFVVNAHFVTLDIGTHTVTYNTSDTDWAGGVLSQDSGTGFNPRVIGNGAKNGFHLKGTGTIQQFSANAPFCPAIFLGQAGARNGWLIEDVNLIPKGESAHGIGPYSLNRSHIRNVSVNSEVTVLDDTLHHRHQNGGYMIKHSDSEASLPALASGMLIENCTLIGGAQGGIHSIGPHCQLVNNTVNHNAIYTNGFGLTASGNQTYAWGNTVHALSGRGIMMDGIDCWVFNNDVEAQENVFNSEYGKVIEAYGIQFEEHVDNSYAFYNDVTVYAESSDAYAMKSTGTVNPHYAYKNNLNAIRVGAGAFMAAIYANTVGQYFESWANTCVSDTVYLYSFWNGISNVSLYGDTLTLGANPTPLGAGSKDRHFVSLPLSTGAVNTSDNNWIVDADVTGFDVTDIYGESSATHPYELNIAHTVTFETSEVSTQVDTLDALSNVADSGLSGSDGVVYADLINTRYYNDAGNGVLSQDLSNHTYSASKAGFTTVNGAVVADSAKTITVTMEPV